MISDTYSTRLDCTITLASYLIKSSHSYHRGSIPYKHPKKSVPEQKLEKA